MAEKWRQKNENRPLRSEWGAGSYVFVWIFLPWTREREIELQPA